MMQRIRVDMNAVWCYLILWSSVRVPLRHSVSEHIYFIKWTSAARSIEKITVLQTSGIRNRMFGPVVPHHFTDCVDRNKEMVVYFLIIHRPISRLEHRDTRLHPSRIADSDIDGRKVFWQRICFHLQYS